MLLLLALKWCLTLCDRMDSSPPGSSIHGHFQARILDWVWFPSPGNLLGPGIKLVTPALTGGWSSTEPPGKPREDTIAAAQFPCCVWLSVATWTVTHWAPLSMGIARQEHWNGLPFPSLEDLPKSGIEPASPSLTGQFFNTEPTGMPRRTCMESFFNFNFIFSNFFKEILKCWAFT